MTTQTEQKPKSDKSKTVLLSIWLFVLALGGGLVAISTPAVATLAIIVGLTAIGFSVLSLREDL